jgi:isopentenyldiphosphate isomerase
MTEWLDIFDDNGDHLGTKEREAVHQNGDWHRTFDCWLVRRDPHPAVLFQRRSRHKRDYPELLDVSVGGHIRAGETLADASREIAEELGISLAFATLTFAGIRTVTSRTPTRIDREFQHVFFAEVNRGLSEFRPDRREVDGLVWLDLDAVMDLFQHRIAEVPGLLHDSQGNRVSLPLRRSHFVPCRDRYYQRVCIMAQRYLEGHEDLAI